MKGRKRVRIAQYLKQVECGNPQRTLAETSEIGEAEEGFVSQSSAMAKITRLEKPQRTAKPLKKKQRTTNDMNTCTVAKVCDPIPSATIKIHKAVLKAECLMH